MRFSGPQIAMPDIPGKSSKSLASLDRKNIRRFFGDKTDSPTRELSDGNSLAYRPIPISW
jgi:hypothetical protein